jgi:hypothetical protein
MHIPRFWVKAEGECTRDGRKLGFAVWGWGADAGSARREATARLQRLLDRVRRGEPPSQGYEYASRPPREEILETFADGASSEPYAVVTRNRYGAQVLNTTDMLFLDIDVPEEGLLARIGRVFSGNRADGVTAALASLRDALRRHGRSTFRLYRTAAGLRAIAIDREYDPAGRDAQELMKRTGTDPAFIRLCLAQRSFRARLTPKPWRCGHRLPPGAHPRTEPQTRQSYAEWLSEYESHAARYATCRYLETVGAGGPRAGYDKLVALHDRVTRCGETLPLA